jgi:hypothetical protein
MPRGAPGPSRVSGGTGGRGTDRAPAAGPAPLRAVRTGRARRRAERTWRGTGHTRETDAGVGAGRRDGYSCDTCYIDRMV